MMQNQSLLQKAKVAFSHIFKNTDAFGRMFNENINQKILLYPTNGYYLTSEQFYALTKTLKACDEQSFYLAVTEGDCFSQDSSSQNMINYGPWKLNSDATYEEYIALNIVLENALYSPNGTWGLIISHEDHAVIGGNDFFIQSFKKEYEYNDDDLNQFLDTWEYNKKNFNSNITWLPHFLDYIDQ